MQGSCHGSLSTISAPCTTRTSASLPLPTRASRTWAARRPRKRRSQTSGQEEVTEHDKQFVEIRSPEAYLLKAGEYTKEFEKDAKKSKTAKSVALPSLDGSEGTQQFYLADKAGELPYVPDDSCSLGHRRRAC